MRRGPIRLVDSSPSDRRSPLLILTLWAATLGWSSLATAAGAMVTSGAVVETSAANDAASDSALGAQADLAITKTDDATTFTPGLIQSYTIVASNAGPSNASGATVSDAFPAALNRCNWTCAGAGGTCTASGSGDISDTVSLPAGGSVTYSVSCFSDSSATGTLSNTATVAAPAGVTDPDSANNSATDTDTLTPMAGVSL